MSAFALRILVFLVVAGAVYFGVRKIWRDWKAQFRALDARQHQRDLRERQRPDVIDLKRSSDGVFRPNDKDGTGGDRRD